MRRLLLSLLLAAALLPAPAVAQDAPPTERLTIGLVLSGGGARGLAHVGVLRELERMRVPVDLVAGTSMGAIVGGLWAAGVPPDSIDATLDGLDWSAVLSERPPRSALDERARALQRRYSFEMELGLSGEGLRLPGGLIAGQALEDLFRRHTLAVAAVEDFSSLPTPYLAVATDLERGDSVVFRSGDLVRAMRASMAIPVVFTPVEIDGRILVDGGLVDNLPVELAERAGAQVTIAVDAAPRYETGPGVRTLTGVATQVTTIASRRELERQLALADVPIAPDLDGYDIFAFGEADSIVEAGARAVREAADRLAPYVLDEAAYAAWRAGRAVPSLPATIDGVEIGDAGRIDPRRIRARIDLDAGDPLEADRLEAAAHAAYAIGAFDRVGWDLARRDGGTLAVLDPDEASVGPSVLRFGLDLVTDSGGGDLATGIVTFTGRAAWIREEWNARGGASLVEVAFGQTTGASAEFRQPVDWAGRWFVEPRLAIEEENQPIAIDDRVVGELDATRRAAALTLGRVFGRSALATVGLSATAFDVETESGIPADAFDEDAVAVDLALTVDRLDDASLPARGILLDARLRSAREALGGERDWDRLEAAAKAFGTLGRTTAFATADLVSGLGTRPPLSEDARIGGFLSLSGWAPGEIRGPYGGSARVGLLHRVASVPPALRGVFVGGWVEAGGAWPDSESIDLDDLEWAGTLAAGAETILGPVWVAYGRAEAGRDRVYVAIGPAL